MQFENFLNRAKSFSEKEQYPQLVEYLKASVEILSDNVELYENLLESMEISPNSILCAAFINELFKNERYFDTSFKFFCTFIKEFNVKQINHFMHPCVELCVKVANMLIEFKTPIRGILPIIHFIKKVRENESNFTSLHATLCLLCLNAKCFKPALSILDTNVTNFNASVQKIVIKDVLLYYYYGGMIYLTQKNLERAMYFFEVVVTTPAWSLSLIMLEGYKKFILTSLLLHGKLVALPKFTSHIVSTVIKPHSKPYHELANAFMNSNLNDFLKVIETYRKVFRRDFNLGLVEQLISVFNRKNIHKLTKTFLRLSLTDVSNRIGLNDPNKAENYILQMIENKEICASINQDDGMVLFKDEDDKFDGYEVYDNLQKYIECSIELDKQICSMDDEVKVNPLFVKRSLMESHDEESSKIRVPF